MAKQDEQEIQNTTGTELDILKNIEKSFFDKNPKARKRNTLKSLKWFQQYIPKNYNRVRTARMFRDRDLWRKQMTIGKMYFFDYSDPVHKDSLPIYDAFPLIFPFSSYRSKEGKEIIVGINLHYLPPALRFVVMKGLIKYRNEKRYRNSTKLMIQWDLLKNLAESKYFEHAVHSYRTDHIKSVMIEIPSQSWELALYLPTERFKKGSKQQAWNIKRKKK